ncbi:metallophosphoesterase, partial [Erwinia amylovora]|uniref:metallophosphoesterase n=1 Tax=Erwinia amylovora TaxID=552 RepID=UPI0020BF5ED3
MSKHNNKCILVVSDLHAPFNHPDSVAFLKAIKAKYKPTRVILTGDEVDFHAISFHDSDPDLDSAGKELEKD